MAILAFRLFGPLAAWGTSEAGEAVRPTGRHPGRSAVFGILAAALGLTRDESEDESHRTLANGYALAVAAYGRRRLLRDYRTVQTVEPVRTQRKEGFTSRRDALERGNVHTMVSKRDHLQDGLWTAFLWPRHGTHAALDELAEALRRPRFDLYLGRRCCPLALPPDPQVLDTDGLEDALAGYPPFPAFEGGRDRASVVLRESFGRLAATGAGMDLAWDEDFPGAPEMRNFRLVRDEPMSRSRRAFGMRREAFQNRTARDGLEGGA